MNNPTTMNPYHKEKTFRVLQLLPTLETGGTERGTVDIASAIKAIGWLPYVASYGGSMVNDLIRIGGKHLILPLQRRNPISIGNNILRLAKLIVDERIDLVHARSRAPAWSALYATRLTKRPFVTTYHGTYNTNSRLKTHYNSIMASGDRVIAISEFIGEHIRSTYGTSDQRLRVVPRGIDLKRFNPAKVQAERMIKLARQWRIPDDRPVIMLPARLTRWKGHVLLIEALKLLKKVKPYCLMIGSHQGHSRYYKSLLSKIRAVNLEDVVGLVGHCSDMPAAYMLSDAVVSASTDPEAFGRVVVEAQAMGRPTIASNHGGSRENIHAGKTGWLVPPNDAAALAEALYQVLLLSPKQRSTLAERAITYVHNRFSKEHMCAQTLGIYRELLYDSAPKTNPD